MTRATNEGLTGKLARSGVVAAAAEVFGRIGFAKARVEDILEAAGIARRTFYKHFGSKEDVLAAVYEFATSTLLEAVRAEARATDDPLAPIVRGLDTYLDFHVENGALLRVLVEQAIRSDSPLAPLRKRFRAELARAIDDAVRAATHKSHDPLLYLALVSALEGVSLELLASTPTAADVRRGKRVMRALVARSLLSGRARERLDEPEI